MHMQGITRRSFVTISATMLAMGLFGCGKADEAQDATDAGKTDAGKTEEKPIVGGWEVNTDAPTGGLTDEQQAVIDRATENYADMELLPVCVLGTQVVSGTNYAFLCLGTPAVTDAKTGWYVAVVYEDLGGSCEVSSVNEINASDPATADASVPEGLTGGWAVAQSVAGDAIDIPEEAASAFTKASESYTDGSLSTLALLATQVVAGTNYRLLCVGEPTAPEAESQLYVVDVYEDLEGAAEISDVEAFDLLAYV